MKLPDQLWLAELGRLQTTWVYDVGKDNSMDVMKDAAGIAYRLRWKLDEKELALYESERTGGPAVKLHCPIRMQCLYYLYSTIACTDVVAEGFPCSSGPLAQYSEPLEICPLVDGQVHLTKVHALKGKGVTHTNPLGVASGASLAMKAPECMLADCHRHRLSGPIALKESAACIHNKQDESGCW